jgi:hypothetical protein
MDVAEVDNARTVLVIGAPRSGTTWLGKILDSSPSVLYRHEPDTLAPEAMTDAADIPRIVGHHQIARHAPAASAYLETMVASRHFKTSGKLPVFSKQYRTRAGQLAYAAMIMALHLTQQAARNPRRMQAVQVPDMVNPAQRQAMTVVLKLVGARGRAGLFAASRPGMRIVFILRDPFGQIASTLRGIALRKFARNIDLQECLETPQAGRYGMTRAVFDRLDTIEQHAWHWALLNEQALEDLRGNPDAMIVHYRDLVRAPHDISRTIFAFCGLDWSGQTSRFLHASTTSERPDGYYQVFKNSAAAMTRWQDQLRADDQHRIALALAATQIWRLYPEYHSLSQANAA